MKTTQLPLTFFFLAVAFCICMVISNILAVKQFDILGWPSTAGLILFPFTYIINDCVAEIWGYKKIRLLIWTAFFFNFAVSLIFQLSILLPPAHYWTQQEAYALVVGQTPRIVWASLMAFLGGSFINAYIMSKMKIKHAGKKFALRAIVSSLAGECVDTFIFTVCGFAFAIPTTALFQIILTETVLKTLFEIVLLPITQKIVRSLKKSNQTDIYDNNISYNILRIKDLD